MVEAFRGRMIFLETAEFQQRFLSHPPSHLIPEKQVMHITAAFKKMFTVTYPQRVKRATRRGKDVLTEEFVSARYWYDVSSVY